MIKHEKRAVISLSLIMASRMLGMFMILPVFSLYAAKLSGATPTRIGIALGIYGLTQALFQIPMGSLSDKFGRKKIITYGLLLFAVGSLIAAFAHSITGIIIGRAMQGAGAIGSTVLATVADLTQDENRSKAMAVLGLTIGLSFAVALVAGPAINHAFQLQGIFLTTCLLALIGIVLLHTLVPTPPQLNSHSSASYKNNQAVTTLKNTQLLRLNCGIFSLHAILTATFVATPILLTHNMALTQWQQTLLYLVVLGLAFVLMLPFIIIGEKRRKLKGFLIGAIAVLLLCEVILMTEFNSLLAVGITLIAFFTAFTFLEASLPSLVSKIAPLERKGTAMGIYSSTQFMGIFVGGTVGGLLFDHFQFIGLFGFCAAVAAIWLIIAISMKNPPYLSTCIFTLDVAKREQIENIKQFLTAQQGVAEFAVFEQEKLLYVKADRQIVTKDQLRKLMNTCNLEE